MNLRKLSLTALALAALSPSISSAGAEDHALKACVDAFAASIPGLGSPAVKVKYARYASSALADYYAHEYTFTMHANDPKTMTSLASVSCSATQQGTVTGMRTLSVSKAVTLAAR
jgi:predicted flavoprotein YhiN